MFYYPSIISINLVIIFLITDKIELVFISSVIYEIIDILICGGSSMEPNPVVIRLLFKVVLPKLLAASVDTKNANVSTQLFNIIID